MAWDSTWQKVFESQGWGRYPGEDLIRFIARNFYPLDRKNVKLLEVGFGVGANIWYMSREGFDVYGIEGSKTGVQKCYKRLKEDSLNANLEVGDIINLPYENDFFDGVIDIECLYCNDIENTHKILEEIKRVTKKGGKFYSRTFTDKMYLGKTNMKLNESEYKDISDGPLQYKGFVRVLPEKEIKSLYGKYFDIISIDKSSYSINNGDMHIHDWNIICQK